VQGECEEGVKGEGKEETERESGEKGKGES